MGSDNYGAPFALNEMQRAQIEAMPEPEIVTGFSSSSVSIQLELSDEEWEICLESEFFEGLDIDEIERDYEPYRWRVTKTSPGMDITTSPVPKTRPHYKFH